MHVKSIPSAHLQVQIMQIIQPNIESRPCHDGHDYDAYLLGCVQTKMLAAVNCTVPFIPSSVRKNGR